MADEDLITCRDLIYSFIATATIAPDKNVNAAPGKEAEAASLSAPSIPQKLHELCYTAPEIADIRALIEIFSHGNMPAYCEGSSGGQ
jgi:hypothetical protein